jgi:hypothetical protein
LVETCCDEDFKVLKSTLHEGWLNNRKKFKMKLENNKMNSNTILILWRLTWLLHFFNNKMAPYLKEAFDFSFDGGGVSSLPAALLLEGEATGNGGLFLVSSLRDIGSLLGGVVGLVPLLPCRKWVPESAVSRRMARLGGDCLRSSPEVFGAALPLGRRKWLLQSGATFADILRGEG